MRRPLLAITLLLLCAIPSFAQKSTNFLAARSLGGLQLQVLGGVLYYNGVRTSISQQNLTLTDNSTNYVFIFTPGTIQQNTTGYPVSGLPIAQVVTVKGQIINVEDDRPDWSFTDYSALNCGTTTVICVGGSNPLYSGDIGAQINAAYAALPAPNLPTYSTGGKIVVLPPATGNRYNYSTPIVLATAGKIPTIEGAAGDANTVELNYTPITATTAITADWTPTSGTASSPGAGFRDITLINNGCVTAGGCSSSATGFQFGGTNWGANTGFLRNVQILGFGTAMTFSTPNTWGMTFIQLTCADNTTCISNTQTLEEMHVQDSIFAGNGTIITASNGDWYFSQDSLDQAITVGFSVSGGHYHIFQPHFETSSGSALTTHFVVSSGTAEVEIYGGLALDDTTTSTSDYWFQFGGYSGIIDGLHVQTLGRSLTTGVVNAIGNSRGFIRMVNDSSGTLTTLLAGANTGQWSNLSFNSLNSNANHNNLWATGSPQYQLFSQAAGTDASLQMGRTALESHLDVIGAAGDCQASTTAGDVCLRNNNASNKIRMTVGGTQQTAIDTSALTHQTGVAATDSVLNLGRTATNDVVVSDIGTAGDSVVGSNQGDLTIRDNTANARILVGNNSGVVIGSFGGTNATVTGTGACATITTQAGNSTVGTFKCTGTTGASTITIAPGVNATNGWNCLVQDETNRANTPQQTSHAAGNCILTVTSVTQNDVFTFTASPF